MSVKSPSEVVKNSIEDDALSIIFFALAKILDNQENILFKLDNQEKIYRKSFIQKKIVCPKCNSKYDSDYTSCPYCGYRE